MELFYTIILLAYCFGDFVFAGFCLTKCFNKEYNPYMKILCLSFAICLIARFICRLLISKNKFKICNSYNQLNLTYYLFYLPSSYTCAFYMVCYVLHCAPLLWKIPVNIVRWFFTLFVNENSSIIIKFNQVINYKGKEFFISVLNFLLDHSKIIVAYVFISFCLFLILSPIIQKISQKVSYKKIEKKVEQETKEFCDNVENLIQKIKDETL